jgi:PAS domain S-box-containing protein
MSKTLSKLLESIHSINDWENFQALRKEINEQFLELKKEMEATQFKYQRSSKEKNIIYSLLNKTSQDLNKAVASIKFQAEELSTLLSAIPAFVYFKNTDHTYRLVNKTFEDFLGVRLDDIRGKTIHDLLPEYDSNAYEKKETMVLKTGKPLYNVEETIVKNNKKIWLSTNIAPVKNINNVVIGLVGVSYNVTERKKHEIELKKAKELAEAGTKAKSEFLANVSHEIRTPMYGIIGMTEILNHTALSTEQKQHLGAIESSAGSLLSLINDVLDFSKIEAGKLDFDIIDFQLKIVLNDIENILKIRADEKGLELKIFYDQTIPETLRGDPNRLKQVILNLANNAVKFTEKGHVHIIIKSINEHQNTTRLKFEIKDTGIGIPKRGRDRLFKEFSQIDASTTRKYGGTGLGLSISKLLTGMMNGEIGVESQFGKGSTFWFTAEFGKASKSMSVTPLMDQDQKDFMARIENDLSILLVEDNQINQKIARFNLEKVGYSVDVAENGHDAVIKYKDGIFDLILMDVLMPVMNGIKATEHIRAIERYRNKKSNRHRHIPIVALTANAMKSDRDACLAAGMDAYISKPFRQKDLVELLTKLVAVKSASGEENPLQKQENEKR